MKHSKDLQFLMDHLRSMGNRGGLGTEQKKALEKSVEYLKQLWRNPNPTRVETLRLVRTISEAIIKNFTQE